MERYNTEIYTKLYHDKKKRHIEPGTPLIKQEFKIVIDTQGPYLVYGNPPLNQQFIAPDREENPWSFVKGKAFPTTKAPTALCRCGHSKNHPYCDGSHLTTEWDPTLTADNIPLLENAQLFDGPTLQITDNQTYCAYARFCDAGGRVWNLVEQCNDPEIRDMVIHDVIYCPSGRLKVWDKQEETFIELKSDPSLGLIEDPQEFCSGPLWVKGGIPINDSNGEQYELRNRVTLCRCGNSYNKPFCDGTHVTSRFHDDLPHSPEKEYPPHRT